MNGLGETSNFVILDGKIHCLSLNVCFDDRLNSLLDLPISVVFKSLYKQAIESWLHSVGDGVLSQGTLCTQLVEIILLNQEVTTHHVQVRVEAFHVFREVGSATLLQFKCCDAIVCIFCDLKAFINMKDSLSTLLHVACDDERVHDGAGVVGVSVVFRTLERLIRVSTIEVPADVLADIFLK